MLRDLIAAKIKNFIQEVRCADNYFEGTTQVVHVKRLEFFLGHRFIIKVNVFMENLRAGMSNPAKYKKQEVYFKRK